MEEFEVIWPHQGDKFYNKGDTRTAHPAVVKHLVDNGTLKPKKKKPATKDKPKKKKAAPLNKAEGAAQQNKTSVQYDDVRTSKKTKAPAKKKRGFFRKKG